MTNQRQTANPFYLVLEELVFDVVRFPVWWYSTGLKNAGRFWLSQVRAYGEKLSLRILFKNLLQPMYGDYSKTGRAISVGLRLITFFARIIFFVLWVAVVSVLFLIWPALPAIIAYAVYRQL